LSSKASSEVLSDEEVEDDYNLRKTDLPFLLLLSRASSLLQKYQHFKNLHFLLKLAQFELY